MNDQRRADEIKLAQDRYRENKTIPHEGLRMAGLTAIFMDLYDHADARNAAKLKAIEELIEQAVLAPRTGQVVGTGYAPSCKELGRDILAIINEGESDD